MNRSLALLPIALICVLLGACQRDQPPRFTGYAEADLIYVAAPVAGQIQRISVQRGARVEAGAELFVLDAEVETYGRAEATARARQAEAQAANLRKGKRPAEIAAIEQQLQQARAALAASRAQLDRNRELVRKNFVSPSRLDDLVSAEERDAARLRELEAQLALARQAARPDEIAAAEALLQAQRAQLASAQWREAQTHQHAPVAAQVFDLLYRPGERVSANTPVIALLPEGGIKLRFYVPQAALARLAIGQNLAVHCDGCPEDMKAQIAFISPQAEYTPPVIYSNENRQKLVFLVEARPIGNAAMQLKPGQPVDVSPLSPL